MEKKLRDLVFLDTETTGLDASLDELIEVSWAVNRGPIKTIFFGVQKVSPKIDALIQFTARGVAAMPAADEDDIAELMTDLHDNTLVAANPAFDRDFLLKKGLWNGHYRMLDIESFAAGRLGLPTPPSMKELYDILKGKGYKIQAPNHTSRRDVKFMRQAYDALRYM